MIEVLKQMVEALEWCHGGEPIGTAEAIKAGKKLIAELESQKPVATLENLEQEIYENTRNFVSLDVMEWMLKRYYTHPPQRTEQGEPVIDKSAAIRIATALGWTPPEQERNFCPRCGKRTNYIHTCTPPKEGA